MVGNGNRVSRSASRRAVGLAALALGLGGGGHGGAPAAEAPPAKKDAPRVACVAPVALIPGATRTLKIRGGGLDQATAVRIADVPEGAVKVKSKQKSEAPKPFDAARVGDTEVVVE